MRIPAVAPFVSLSTKELYYLVKTEVVNVIMVTADIQGVFSFSLYHGPASYKEVEDTCKSALCLSFYVSSDLSLFVTRR